MLVGTLERPQWPRCAKLAAYWLSSFTEKHIELGIVLLSLEIHGSLLATALTGLAFQTGKVFAVFVRVPSSPLAAAVAAIAGTGLLLYDLTSLPVCLAGTALMAAATNYSRRWAKAGVGDVERLKNAARICSILSAPFFSAAVTGTLTLVALLILARHAAHGRLAETRLTATVVGRFQPAHLAMAVHHAHYFSYSHAVPFLFAQVFDAPPALQGLIFYLGWVGYEVYDFVAIRASSPRFWVGHLLAAAGIVGLFSTTSPFVAALLWMATGIGGGTVVMLFDLGRRDDPDPAWNLEVVEYYGHLSGMLVLVALAQLVTLPTIGLVAGLLALVAPFPLVWRHAVPRGRAARGGDTPLGGGRTPLTSGHHRQRPPTDAISPQTRRLGWNSPCAARPSETTTTELP